MVAKRSIKNKFRTKWGKWKQSPVLTDVRIIDEIL
jgi:hypothetical protein